MQSQTGYIELDKDQLQAQRRARSAVRRDSIIILTIVILAYILWLIFYRYLITFLPSFIVYSLLIVFYLLVRVAINWRGWAALQAYNIRCPHCHRLLAEKIDLFKSPSRRCPYCGQMALASLKQLTQTE